LLLFLLAGGLAAVLALTLGSARARAQDPAQLTAASMFAVFAKAPTPADALAATSAYSHYQSRRIAADDGAISVFGVDEGGQVCVTLSASSGVAAGGPAACNSVSELSQPNQLLVLGASSQTTSTTNPAPQVLAGLVPNGVSNVEVDFTDGSSVDAPVTNNGFILGTDGRTPSGFKWSINGTAFGEGG
jgi:hypothetical protein